MTLTFHFWSGTTVTYTVVQDRDGGHRHHRLTASSPVRTVAPGCYVPAMAIRTNGLRPSQVVP